MSDSKETAQSKQQIRDYIESLNVQECPSEDEQSEDVTEELQADIANLMQRMVKVEGSLALFAKHVPAAAKPLPPKHLARLNRRVKLNAWLEKLNGQQSQGMNIHSVNPALSSSRPQPQEVTTKEQHGLCTISSTTQAQASKPQLF